jgi:hypothetical protein
MPATALSVPLRALPLVAFKYPAAQICVLWSLQPYLSVHKYVYLATSTLPFSAQIHALRPLKLNELSCSIECCDIFEQQNDWQLYKKYLSPWRLLCII